MHALAIQCPQSKIFLMCGAFSCGKLDPDNSSTCDFVHNGGAGNQVSWCNSESHWEFCTNPLLTLIISFNFHVLLCGGCCNIGDEAGYGGLDAIRLLMDCKRKREWWLMPPQSYLLSGSQVPSFHLKACKQLHSSKSVTLL